MLLKLERKSIQKENVKNENRMQENRNADARQKGHDTSMERRDAAGAAGGDNSVLKTARDDFKTKKCTGLARTPLYPHCVKET